MSQNIQPSQCIQPEYIQSEIVDIMKSSIQSAVKCWYTSFADKKMCTIEEEERMDHVKTDFVFICRACPMIIKNILCHLSLEEIRMLSLTCRYVHSCVKKLLISECESQINIYQTCGIDPIVVFNHDKQAFQRAQKDKTLNTMFGMGSWLFREIIPEAIENQCKKREEWVTRDNAHLRPSYEGESENGVQFLRIASQNFRVIDRNDRFFLAAPQCATAACEDGLSSCKKWIQVDCQAACWTETLLDIARIKDGRKAEFDFLRQNSSNFITLIERIFKHITHDDGLKQFAKFLYGEIPFDVQGKDMFKKHIEALTSKCLDEKAQRKNFCPVNFQKWRENFSVVALYYLQSKGHILFCYRISRESTFCYKRVVPRCFEKALFMYYLIENKDDLNNFLREYLDDVCSSREAYFSYETFCASQEGCRAFLPEEIIKFQEICICRLMSISSALGNSYFGLESLLKAENQRCPPISLRENPPIIGQFFCDDIVLSYSLRDLIRDLLQQSWPCCVKPV